MHIPRFRCVPCIRAKKYIFFRNSGRAECRLGVSPGAGGGEWEVKNTPYPREGGGQVVSWETPYPSCIFTNFLYKPAPPPPGSVYHLMVHPCRLDWGANYDSRHVCRWHILEVDLHNKLPPFLRWVNPSRFLFKVGTPPRSGWVRPEPPDPGGWCPPSPPLGHFGSGLRPMEFFWGPFGGGGIFWPLFFGVSRLPLGEGGRYPDPPWVGPGRTPSKRSLIPSFQENASKIRILIHLFIFYEEIKTRFHSRETFGLLKESWMGSAHSPGWDWEKGRRIKNMQSKKTQIIIILLLFIYNIIKFIITDLFLNGGLSRFSVIP